MYRVAQNLNIVQMMKQFIRKEMIFEIHACRPLFGSSDMSGILQSVFIIL